MWRECVIPSGLSLTDMCIFPLSQGLEGPIDDSMKSTRTVLKEMALNMRDKSVSYAKAFALFGALYAFNECVIEKFRAKHDKVNPALAGCATGAMLAYSGGNWKTGVIIRS